ncbi:MAG: hypothetical protein ABI863_07370, partial [Ginsengibacter sp.]
MKHLLCFALAVCSYFFVVGQPAEKIDVVFKANGDQLKGSVVEVTDDNIRFKYTGEQVIYSFKKSDIQKITFASGRTETYNNIPSANNNSSTPVQNTVPATPASTPGSGVTASAEDRRNKVAILPFSFLKDGQNLPQEASDELQHECFTRLSGHSGTFSVVNPRATNVLLAKAGIDKSNMIKYSMAEICKILGVEYVVDGMVNQSNTSQSSTGNTSYDFKNDKNKKSNNDKISGSSRTSTNVNQEYETFTTINIYNDKNENIYSQRRKAL